MDIDCRSVTYSSNPSKQVEAAALESKDAPKKEIERNQAETLRQRLDNIDDWFERFEYSMYLAAQKKEPVVTVASPYQYNKTDANRTDTVGESLDQSMLKFLDKESPKYVMEEAFCRDIDAFNTAFIVSKLFNYLIGWKIA